MKKFVAALLTAVLVGLTACSSDTGGSAPASEPGSFSEVSVMEETPTPEPTEEPTPMPEPVSQNWEIIQTVDDFGDPTGDSVLRGTFEGTFANTATSDSLLIGAVFFQQASVFSDGTPELIMSFRLLEYGSTIATYLDSSEKELKIKIGDEDEVRTYELMGLAPNLDVFASIRSDDPIYVALYSGYDVRCVITIGNSKYNFTVESGNIAEVLDSQ